MCVEIVFYFSLSSCSNYSSPITCVCVLFVVDKNKYGAQFEFEGRNVMIAPSKYGFPKLHLDGYIYLRNVEKYGKVYWVCERARKIKCKARAITYRGKSRITINEFDHNHRPGC